MGTSCFGMSSKQFSAHNSAPPQQMSTPPAVATSMQPALQAEQPAPARAQSTPFRAQQLQQSKAHPALTTLKLAPIKTKPAAKRGFFSRIRPARHPRAEKAYDTKENSVYVAANAQEQPQVVYDLQRPLIV